MKPANRLCQCTDRCMIWVIWALSCILPSIARNMQGLNCHISLRRLERAFAQGPKGFINENFSLLFYVNDKLVMDAVLPFQRGNLCLRNLQEGACRCWIRVQLLHHLPWMEAWAAFPLSFSSFFFPFSSLPSHSERAAGKGEILERDALCSAFLVLLGICNRNAVFLFFPFFPFGNVCTEALENERISLHWGETSFPGALCPLVRYHNAWPCGLVLRLDHCSRMPSSHGMPEVSWMLQPPAVLRLRVYVKNLKLNMFLSKYVLISCFWQVIHIWSHLM